MAASLEFPKEDFFSILERQSSELEYSRARPRPHHPAAVRLRLRDGQHRPRRRTGQHRGLGHQQAPGPAGRPGGHAPARCASATAWYPPPPARPCWSTPAPCSTAQHASSATWRAIAAGARGQVRVLARVSAMAESLADDVAAFLQMPAHRNIQVDMEERVSPEIVRGVREGMASLGVCWDAAELGPLQSRPTAATTSASWCRRVIRWPHAKALRFEQTLDYEHVGLPVNSAVQVMLQRAAARLGRTLIHRVIVTNFEAALARGARGPGHQPGAARGGRAAGCCRQPADHSAGRVLGGAPLHRLLSRRTAALAGCASAGGASGEASESSIRVILIRGLHM